MTSSAVVCPECRGWENAPVAAARVDERGRREKLPDRLAIAPAPAGDRFTHSVEGVLLAFLAGAAGAYFAEERDMPWLTAVGAVAAVLVLAITIAVVREETRESRQVRDGRPRAEALSAGAHYCFPCRGVFHPAAAWQGVVSPELFRHRVWTGAGYGDRLDEEAKRAGGS